MLTENSSIEPHQDIFKRDDEITLNDNGQIKEQIAFNYFLDNAEDTCRLRIMSEKSLTNNLPSFNLRALSGLSEMSNSCIDLYMVFA